MTDHIADPQAVCPFVAFDDERDFRSPGPDHRHRCFAESPAAPRALAHQAAYCLSTAFPGCPTFADWARREAAPVKAAPAPHSLRDSPVPARATGLPAAPAGSPAGPVVVPSPPADRPVSAPPPRRSDEDWTAPPPWAVGAVAAGTGAALAASDDERSPGGAAGDDGGPARLEPGSAPPGTAEAADAPSFLTGRSRRPTPAASWDDGPGEVGGAEPLDAGAEAPPADPSTGPRRVPVGYAPVGYAPVPPATDRKAGSSSREHRDPAAPSWEEPRRLESYPTLKSRGAGGLPRPAVYAIVILLVGVGLFATPFILRGIGGGGGEASPTPAASASVVPTEEPSPTAEPTPEEVVYKVKKGDALGKIAAKYGVTVDQILAANPNIKNANQIAVGDKIIIPQPLPSEVVDGEVTPAP